MAGIANTVARSHHGFPAKSREKKFIKSQTVSLSCIVCGFRWVWEENILKFDPIFKTTSKKKKKNKTKLSGPLSATFGQHWWTYGHQNLSAKA